MPSVKSVRVEAPAKINLMLTVIGRRSDGYHELRSLMAPVALYDVLTLRFGGPRISVSCNHPDVPDDDTNLAARAASLYLDAAAETGISPASGVSIQIDKHIPVGAGLGGGSSDAAAVLAALNNRFGQPLSPERLRKIGVCIGADVPFFLSGGPALASGIGERLKPFAGLTPWTALLVFPNQSISTAWVYKNLNLRLTKEEKKLSKFHFDGRNFDVGRHLVNDLESVTEKALPVIKEIKRLLLAHGAAGAMMSGSGSTVFGLFADAKQAISAHNALQNTQQRQNWALYVADLLI